MIQQLSEIRYKCNGCIHEDVCKYKQEYQKLTSDILNNTIPEQFTININCKNFCNNIGGTVYRSKADSDIALLNSITTNKNLNIDNSIKTTP